MRVLDSFGIGRVVIPWFQSEVSGLTLIFAILVDSWKERRIDI